MQNTSCKNLRCLRVIAGFTLQIPVPVNLPRSTLPGFRCSWPETSVIIFEIVECEAAAVTGCEQNVWRGM